MNNNWITNLNNNIVWNNISRMTKKMIKSATINLKLLLLFILLLQVNIIAFSQEMNNTEQIHTCKVVRIKDVGNAYTITVNYNYDSLGDCYSKVIMSLKTDKKEGVKIKKGKFYDFTFQKIEGYHRMITDKRDFTWYLLINNVPVHFKNTEHYIIREFVLSPCIEGLYYKGCNK